MRALALPVALLAAACLAGCGQSLYDARGVPAAEVACPIGTTLCGDSCVPEDVGHCGATCQACNSAPASASPACNLTSSTCDFACAPGLVPDGSSCVCPGGTVACGAAGACVTESASACGGSCQSCTAPPGATPICNVGHQCDYLCPASLPRKCPTGCCASICTAPAIQCGATCVATESVTQCGPSCTDCTTAGVAVPLHGQVACLGPAGQGACAFACQPGYFKANGACVQVQPSTAGPGPVAPGNVALGAGHTCVLTSAGGVMCWGANGAGQLGVGDTTGRLTPVSVDVGSVSASFLAAGGSHTCAVLSDGSVLCWGDNSKGQLGADPGALPSSPFPVAVPGVTKAVAVAAGAAHTCVIVQGGAVSCWGANDKGQLGGGTTAPAVIATPTAVNLGSATTAVRIAAQVDHTCVITGSKVVSCWGANVQGETGQSASTTPAKPSNLSALSGVKWIAVGGHHTCASGTSGAVAGLYCWGANDKGQLGSAFTGAFTNNPQAAQDLAGGSATLVLTGADHTCAAGSDAVVRCAGANDFLQLGTPPSIQLGAVDVLYGGGNRGCALTSGALRCWGANDRGQLGDGSTAPSATPVTPAGS